MSKLNARDFAKGNWFGCNGTVDIGKIVAVTNTQKEYYVELDFNGSPDCIDYEQVTPIPLTAEILEKAGFERSRHEGRFSPNSLVKYLYDTNTWMTIKKMDDGLFAFVYSGDVFGDYCMFLTTVHQLQNLYFALTGKELEIKF